jgi:hypothetical protein
MKNLRSLVLSSVVAATMLAALDVNVVVAGPLRPKPFPHNTGAVFDWLAKTVRIDEWEITSFGERLGSLLRGTGEWLRKAGNQFEHLFDEAKLAFRQAGREAEIAPLPAKDARARETEARQAVSAVISQAEQNLTEHLSATLVVQLSEEQLQQLIKAAVAQAVEAGSKKPNAKYSFNPRTGMLRFGEPWVVGKLGVDRDINLYADLPIAVAAAGGASYLLECIKTKTINECIEPVFAKIREKVAIGEALAEDS